jgi:hypothetical protein
MSLPQAAIPVMSKYCQAHTAVTDLLKNIDDVRLTHIRRLVDSEDYHPKKVPLRTITINRLHRMMAEINDLLGATVALLEDERMRTSDALLVGALVQKLRVFEDYCRSMGIDKLSPTAMLETIQELFPELLKNINRTLYGEKTINATNVDALSRNGYIVGYDRQHSKLTILTNVGRLTLEYGK